MSLPDRAERFFVRGVLRVAVEGYPQGFGWGVWAEVSHAAFLRIVERWSDAEQADEPPLLGMFANVIPDYRSTLGLPLVISLVDANTRPRLWFDGVVGHPFVHECVTGISFHRAREWNESFARPAADAPAEPRPKH